MNAPDSVSTSPHEVSERFVVHPKLRSWKKDGKSFVGFPPETFFEVSEETLEFISLFGQPRTLEQIEEVADFEEEVMDLLLESRLLVEADETREANADEGFRPFSLKDRVRIFSRDVWVAFTDLFRGERLRASQETCERRHEVCSGCQWYVASSGRSLLSGPKCRACGCYLRIKTALRASRCPIGRW